MSYASPLLMNASAASRPVLCDFRTALHRCFGRRSDALFEVSDALLIAGPFSSPAHLNLQPVHRRGWGCLYAALARGQIDVDALRALVMRHPLHRAMRHQSSRCCQITR